MTDIPIILTVDGLVPQTPTALRQRLVDLVASTNPGYTDDLPGSLIEDITSTDVGALTIIDTAKVETVNSLNPRTANAFLLVQLGNIYGVARGQASNTSVSVVFTGPPGFVIAQGFTVSDGQYQYTASDGGIIGADGTSPPIFCVATISGIWDVPAGTVTQLITSVPSTVQLSVINPQTGTPGGEPESEESYRSSVLQAGRAAAQGMATFLKTLLGNVAGVQKRLISVVQAANNGGWKIIVGGGDPYQVAYAIYDALFDISSLVGSTLSVTNITKANPGRVTTDLNHGYSNGQMVNIAGVLGMTQINNVPITVTVVNEKQFDTGINTTGYQTYTSGGVVTPNFRNDPTSIQDYPDTYVIPIVRPPQQTVEITVTWNTTAINFVSASAIAQLASPALVDYVNSISVGVPMNLFELQTTFQQAVASILPPSLLTRMIFNVSINGVGTAPDAGTGIIDGDPESYFFAEETDITVIQG